MTAVMRGGPSPELERVPAAIARTAMFPHLRYMGSKHKLTPTLASVFAQLGGSTVLDAFSGSGVVSYLLKALGYSVVSNDFLTFPSIIAAAAVANDCVALGPEEVDVICGPAADDRDFIRTTFDGLYFTGEDRRFLDAAWSHIDRLDGAKRELAVAALVLGAARKQPRGVFTVTDRRYDDGRRDLRISMEQQFRECVDAYNRVVFDSGKRCSARQGDVFDAFELFDGAMPPPDVVYLDPPYVPPADDNCYIKRYHFLEGLSVYWRGQTILEGTKTKKLAKRYTPFSYKHTVTDALARTFQMFAGSTIVLSYSSQAVPDRTTIEDLLRDCKGSVEVIAIEHRYSFGTHATAQRRRAEELIFIGH